MLIKGWFNLKFYSKIRLYLTLNRSLIPITTKSNSILISRIVDYCWKGIIKCKQKSFIWKDRYFIVYSTHTRVYSVTPEMSPRPASRSGHYERDVTWPQKQFMTSTSGTIKWIRFSCIFYNVLLVTVVIINRFMKISVEKIWEYKIPLQFDKIRYFLTRTTDYLQLRLVRLTFQEWI